MRKTTLLNQDWTFVYHDGTCTPVSIPHTWNNLDGQVLSNTLMVWTMWKCLGGEFSSFSF